MAGCVPKCIPQSHSNDQKYYCVYIVCPFIVNIEGRGEFMKLYGSIKFLFAFQHYQLSFVGDRGTIVF